MEKQTARMKMKQLRGELSGQEVHTKSVHVIRQLLALREYQNSKSVYTYVNAGQEVETKDLITMSLRAGKKVYVPKVYGREMKFHRIASLAELKPGTFGIEEPITDEIADRYEGIMIIPGLCFDRFGNRIGYGGGFYDRFLSKQTHLVKTAVCFDFQIMDQIAPEPVDIRMDLIVGETQIFKIDDANR